MLRRILFVLLLGLIGLWLVAVPASAQDTCFAGFDINQDGIKFSVQDLVYFGRWLQGQVPRLAPLYEHDLNRDCRIDYADFEQAEWCFIHGPFACLGDFGALPVCCNPDTIMVSCCTGDSCTLRHPDNCLALGGTISDVPMCQTNPCDCCVGLRGNVDGDPADMVDLSDLNCYIDQIFLQIWPPPCDPCLEEADINGDSGLDITDVQMMIDFMFFGSPLPSCP